MFVFLFCVTKNILINNILVDYELCRIYHPDSPASKKEDHEVRQKRFQSISQAYDLLRGKVAVADLEGDGSVNSSSLKKKSAPSSAWQARQRRLDLDSNPLAHFFDSLKEKLFLFAGILVRCHKSDAGFYLLIPEQSMLALIYPVLDTRYTRLTNESSTFQTRRQRQTAYEQLAIHPSLEEGKRQQVGTSTDVQS